METSAKREESVASIAGFRHRALIYETADELIEGTVPFIDEGLAQGDVVIVALPERARRMVRPEVSDPERVEFLDMEAVGRNPACIIPAWKQFVADAIAAERTPRGIGEPVWHGRDEAELDECERYEALLNLAFDDGPAWTLVCPYDAARLPGGGRGGRRPHAPAARDRRGARAELGLRSGAAFPRPRSGGGSRSHRQTPRRSSSAPAI